MTELPGLPDLCWPVDVSCVDDWDAWAVEPVEADPEADPPVEEVEGVPRYSDEQKDLAVAFAAQTMRMLTGYRVGGCPVTVRPCSRACSEDTWQTYPAGYPSGVPWQPVYAHGTWLNIGCGHPGSCGCTGVPGIALGSPAYAVTEVKVDGAALDPAAYRLDAGGILLRVDGGSWPLCQNLAAPDSEDGTWSVTYTPGIPVDGLGSRAAGVLAGQYVRACTGGACDLPATVTQITRNGVTMTLTPDSFPGGLTGIRTVDDYTARWNPYRHKTMPTVLSPDTMRPRVTGL